jgi:hypothetical protein
MGEKRLRSLRYGKIKIGDPDYKERAVLLAMKQNYATAKGRIAQAI